MYMFYGVLVLTPSLRAMLFLVVYHCSYCKKTVYINADCCELLLEDLLKLYYVHVFTVMRQTYVYWMFTMPKLNWMFDLDYIHLQYNE